MTDRRQNDRRRPRAVLSGINSFKVFMAYKGVFMLADDEIFQVFEKCRELGGIAMVHAENGSVITELEKEIAHLGITGPEGHLLSRPEQVTLFRFTSPTIEEFVRI